MRKIILTKGLPGSGKTTWAKTYQKENPNTVLVNKDELRDMLHQGVHSSGREDFVLNIRDAIVIRALEQGQDVIVHDTNFNVIHWEKMFYISRMLPWKGKCSVEIKDFTDVPVEECIRRDLLRSRSVGERVIRKMYRDYLAPPKVEYNFTPDLPFAIICDLDGTLALFPGKNPYERDFINDIVNAPVHEMLIQHNKKYIIILISGRKDTFRTETEQWLAEKNIPYNFLLMRKADDNRKDFIVKKEIYENEIKKKYNIWFVLDDRNQVVSLWRSLGIACFQVAEGDF